MMSVDESLMCSFQILKPAEKKQKYAYGGMGAGKPVTPPRGKKPAKDGTALLPPFSFVSFCLANSLSFLPFSIKQGKRCTDIELEEGARADSICVLLLLFFFGNEKSTCLKFLFSLLFSFFARLLLCFFFFFFHWCSSSPLLFRTSEELTENPRLLGSSFCPFLAFFALTALKSSSFVLYKESTHVK